MILPLSKECLHAAIHTLTFMGHSCFGWPPRLVLIEGQALFAVQSHGVVLAFTSAVDLVTKTIITNNINRLEFGSKPKMFNYYVLVFQKIKQNLCVLRFVYFSRQFQVGRNSDYI